MQAENNVHLSGNDTILMVFPMTEEPSQELIDADITGAYQYQFEMSAMAAMQRVCDQLQYLWGAEGWENNVLTFPLADNVVGIMLKDGDEDGVTLTDIQMAVYNRLRCDVIYCRVEEITNHIQPARNNDADEDEEFDPDLEPFNPDRGLN